MSSLAITLLQAPLTWMDGEANLRHFDNLLADMTDRDVIILPEMFTTGFAMEAAQQALPQQQVVTWLHRHAKRTNALVGGSAAIHTPAGAVNRFYWLSRMARCITMTSDTCFAWRMNSSITSRARRAR